MATAAVAVATVAVNLCCSWVNIMWCIYKIIQIWTAVVDESEEWSSQYIFQFKQLERRSLKKNPNNQGFNGIRTRDLRDTGAMLYQLGKYRCLALVVNWYFARFFFNSWRKVADFCSWNPPRGKELRICKLGEETRREWRGGKKIARKQSPSHASLPAGIFLQIAGWNDLFIWVEVE